MIGCPTCGAPVVAHCDDGRCGWVICTRTACRSYGHQDGSRWINMREAA